MGDKSDVPPPLADRNFCDRGRHHLFGPHAMPLAAVVPPVAVAVEEGAAWVSAHADVPIAAISYPIDDGTLVLQFRHRHGEPRAPPAFSA
jgi:hypothetical protein